MSFPQEYDATNTASVDLHVPRHWSFKQQQAGFPPCRNKVLAECDYVLGRTSIKETCADRDRETLVSSLFESVSREKKDRDQNVVQTLRDWQNLHRILQRKAGLAENWLSKNYFKLRQTWRSKIGKREIQILLFMGSIRSSTPNDDSHNRRINGLIRLKERK